MKKATILTVLLALVVVFAPMTSALAAGYNLAGVGAKALSMSGAYRAIADDAYAIYWNPAGLAGQQQAIYLEGKVLMPSVDLTPAPNAGAHYLNKAYEAKAEVFPSGSFAYVHPINDKMTAGIAIYAPTAIGVTWESLVKPMVTNTQWPVEDWMGSIRVIDIHPTFAYKVNPKLKLGLGLVINYADIALQYPSFIPTGQVDDVQVLAELTGTGMGFGANLGALYDINEKMHVGFNFYSGATLPISGSVLQTVYYPNFGVAPYLGQTASAEPDAEADFPLPMEAGLGFAYDVNDRLTVAVDVQWTNWAVAEIVDVEMTGTGIGGAPAEDGELVLNYEDVIRFNLGANYVVDPAKGFEVRAGYYYDPTAIPDETLRPSITDVANKHSISIGGAYNIMPNVKAECYWEHLFSNTREALDANIVDGEQLNVPGFWKMGVETIGIQFTYFFNMGGEE